MSNGPFNKYEDYDEQPAPAAPTAEHSPECNRQADNGAAVWGDKYEFKCICAAAPTAEQVATKWADTYNTAPVTGLTTVIKSACLEYAASRTAELEKQWESWGVVEIAVRNKQVAEYCDHWEKRAESAERERDQLRERVKELERRLAAETRKSEALLNLGGRPEET